MKRLIFLFTFSLFAVSAPGQRLEHPVVHLDKPFYVLGETIWYRIALPDNLQTDNGLLELTFYTPESAVAERYHLHTEGRDASGYQKIRFEWPEGMYQLQIRAFDINSFASQTLATVPVPVFDDLAARAEEQVEPKQALPAGSGVPSSLRVEVRMEKMAVSPRDEVKATISVRAENGDPVSARLSLAVTDAVLVPGDGPVLFPGPSASAMAIDSLIRFDGTVASSTGESLPGSSLLLAAFLRPLDSLTYTIPGSDGRFGIALPKFYGDGTVQFADIRTEAIAIDRSPKQGPVPAGTPLPFHEPVARYLTLSRERKKIYQIFNSIEMPLHGQAFAQDSAYYEPDRSIRLEDFSQMEDLPAFFREVSTPLKFRRNKGRNVALMFNPDPLVRSFFPGDPLFIVDGILTRDADWVAGLDIRELEQIGLFYDAQKLSRRFGAIGRFGVIVIQSRSGAIRIPDERPQNTFPINGLQMPVHFPVVGTSDAEKTPVFRPQVYWNAGIRTDNRGQAALRFRHSDAKGLFRISVFAHSPQGGTGTGTGTYEVR